MAGQLLTTKEACEYLDVSYWTLMHQLLPEIPHIQRTPRGKIKFKKSTLDKYLEKQEEKSIENRNTIENIIPERKTEEDIVELRRKYNLESKNRIDIKNILNI